MKSNIEAMQSKLNDIIKFIAIKESELEELIRKKEELELKIQILKDLKKRYNLKSL
ncbi:hypothetical protein KDN24_06555 [Bacillus sp. Bva_UNVM-123]|uniref:hypothetical protein n=1 Tax=Bacillus sp. Bva_UNVM-123 TaxID=2829798 RepID=UPI00391EFE81